MKFSLIYSPSLVGSEGSEKVDDPEKFSCSSFPYSVLHNDFLAMGSEKY